jgi:predicted DNA-binding transcriptional regulator YafY
VEVLRQFKGFSYFSEMTDIVSRLEDHVTSAKQHTIPVIDFEKNENLKGLEHLDEIYRAIINKNVLNIKYRSFKARSAGIITFYPYLLKEYRNRWFVFGLERKSKTMRNLALDRMHKITVASNERFTENTLFDPAVFFNDVVGVTKNLNSIPETIRFRASRQDAPYILTKPIHRSQTLIEQFKDGSMIFEISVVINQELHREFFGFANGIKILEPLHLAKYMQRRLKEAVEEYEKTDDIQ